MDVTVVADDAPDVIDSSGGGRSWRPPRRWVLTVASGIVIIAAVVLLGSSGVVAPRVDWPRNGRPFGYSVSGRTVTATLQIANHGWAPIRVTGVGRSGPGIELVDTIGAPVTLAPGAMTGVYLEFNITDCAAVPAGAWPVPILVERPWGTATVHVDMPTEDDVEWQRDLADMACAGS